MHVVTYLLKMVLRIWQLRNVFIVIIIVLVGLIISVQRISRNSSTSYNGSSRLQRSYNSSLVTKETEARSDGRRNTSTTISSYADVVSTTSFLNVVSTQSPPIVTTAPSVGGNGCKEIGPTPFAKTHKWKTFVSALEKYKHFHSKQLQKLRSMSAQLDATGTRDPAMEPVRTLTWSCDHPSTCSGVGDQLFRIQFAFLLAVISDRVFTIYWNEENAKTMQYLEPNEIDWRFYDERLGMHKEHNLNVSNWLDFSTTDFVTFAQLLRSEELHITTTHEFHLLQLFKKMIAKSQYTKSGLFQIGVTSDHDLANPSVGGQILRYLFQFSAEVISLVEEAERHIGLSGHDYLAIHLRTGFVGTSYEENVSSKKTYKKDTWEQLLKFSLEYADKKVGRNSSVYLATDSYVAKEWAVQKSQRVKVINMNLLHVAIQRSWSDNVSTGTGNGYLAIWIDFLLLARARVLVHGISSFSSNAGRLCSIPPTRQITMQKHTGV